MFKKFTVGVAVILLFTCIFSTASVAYSDVGNRHWAGQHIAILSAQGVIGGYPDGTFRPDRPVTRAEFCNMIINGLYMRQEALALQSLKSSFSDIPDHHWAKGFVEFAYELGIVTGYEDKTFGPDTHINRAEAAAILVRVLGSGETGEGSLPFEDAEKIPSWARTVVGQAYNQGLIKGDENGYFRPYSNTTRAEAAVMIARVLERYGDKYDFVGSLKGIDVRGKRMRIEINGRELIFRFHQLEGIYRGKNNLSLDDLTDLLPVDIYFILDDEGNITYIELAEDEDSRKVIQTFQGKRQFESGPKTDEAGPFNRTMEGAGSREPDEELARDSLQLTLEAIKADELKKVTEATGKNQVVAIIDTGVDPGHPDLKATTGDNPKIISWADFTAEGRIETAGFVSKRRSLKLDETTYELGNIPTGTGLYRYGFFKESSIMRDINFNGSAGDSFLVLLTAEDDDYDTVYIDTDGDLSLRDEIPVKHYSEKQQVVTFGTGESGERYNFVVSDIDPGGKYIQLSTDLNGHGTHVAGIIAANGKVQGVAPGAELIVIKALDSTGKSEWKTLHKAIRYAAEEGADIINLSLGYYNDKTAGNNSLTDLISEVAREDGVIFTVATGNRGPGVATLATPGNALDAISVGAFISPEMWEHDYGWDIRENTLWYFSSLGPRKDGLNIPTVVAPGSVISTAPLWSGEEYYHAEGTSIAAPFAAGGAALLKESMEKIDKNVTPDDIKRAIIMGAAKMEGFQPFEVGAGALDLLEAWHQLLVVEEIPRFAVETYDVYYGKGRGIYARNFIPGKMFFDIKNGGNREAEVFWQGEGGIIAPEMGRTRIPPGKKRSIPVRYSIPEKPGIYSEFLIGDVPATYGRDILALSTLIIPHRFTGEDNYKLEFSGELAAGHFRRYFFEVPPGVEDFKVRLEIAEEGSGDYKGRMRFHLLDPGGREVYASDYAGLAPEGAVKRGRIETTVDSPQEGVWEVVVYSSASLSEYGLRDSYYELQCALRGVSEEGETDSPSGWLIGYIPPAERTGSTVVTLHVRDENSKRPVDGVVEVNGRYYQVKNGMVRIRLRPEEEIKIN